MTSTTETTDVQAIQFNGLDDYLRIVGWMKDCGDTYALADEIRYTTPIMLLQTSEGTKAASPGDWIVRGDDGGFSVASHGKAETPTVRTYRIQYNPGRDLDGESETFVDAEEYHRAGPIEQPWLTFVRDGRIVAEISERSTIVIEELQPLNPSEREELEELRELIASLEDEQDAHLARAVARLRETAERDREREAQPGADWSAYADCPECHKPTGESCVVGNLTLHRWPHRARPLLAPAEATVGDDEQTDWSAYHACGECGQRTGQPCMSAQGGVARINPHQYRELLPAA